MKKFFLILVMFLIAFSSSAKKKEKLYDVGFTINITYRDKDAGTSETIKDNTIYLYEVQILFDLIYTNINADLYEQLKKSHEFGILTEKFDFYVQRKKLIPGKNCEMKFKRIKNKEKELYYNKF
jgi:hypothetical protein